MLSYLAGALVVGSVVVVDPWGFAPFGPAKVTVVAVIVLVAAAFAGRTRPRMPRFFLVCWSVLLGWMLLAAALAVDPLHAWIGTPDRRLGWIAWLVFFCAFVVGVADAGDRRVVRAGAIAALALGLYSALESAGGGVDVTFAGGRLGGPYGQPAYLGAAAVLLLPVAAGVAVDRCEVAPWRAAGALGAMGGVGALAGSGTRAAWVGLAAGAAVVAPRVWSRVRARPVIGATAVAVAVALVVLTPIATRFGAVTDEGGTARGRVAEWRVASRVVADRPLVGAGPEGYRVVFGSAVDAGYERTYGREVLPDRAHNGALDVAVTGGLPALGAYGALAVGIVVAAWRTRRSRGALTGVAVGVVAYLAQQLFLFPTIEIDPVLWLFAGVLVGTTCRDAPSVPIPRAFAPVAAVLAVVTLAAGALDVAADRQLHRAVDALDKLDAERALAAADRATDLRPDSIRTWFVAARIAHAPGTIRAVDGALDRIESGLDVSPRDPALRTEYGALLLERAERSRLPEDAERAVAVLGDLVADDPVNEIHRQRLAAARDLLR